MVDPSSAPSSMSVGRGARTADRGNFDLSSVDGRNVVASVGCTENQDGSNPRFI